MAGCSGDTPTARVTAKAATTSTLPVNADTADTGADGDSTTSTSLSAERWKTVTYEQDSAGLAYAGGWTNSSADGASKRGFIYAEKAGAMMTFHFVGTYCAWVAKTAANYGKASVTIDDRAAVTVDLYSKSTMWRHVVWQTKDLAFGDHTVKIVCLGKKRTAAKGASINVDSIQVTGAVIGRYQQTDSRIDYSGAWSTTKDRMAAGGSFAVTKSARAMVTVTFTGVQLDWQAKKGPAYGQAWVMLDDGEPVLVDLYDEGESWRQTAWSSGRLSMSTHAVTISCAGTKCDESTGTYIDVDSFEVAGVVK